MQLGSHVAVALVWAGGYSSDWTLAWELPYASSTALEKTKQNKTTHTHTKKTLLFEKSKSKVT